MRHTRALLLLFALFIAAGAHAQCVAQTPATQSPTPAQTSAHDAKKGEAKRRYESVAFESRLVGASLPYNVVLPPDYKRGSSKHRRYPVVYLLHGLAGSADDWVSSRAHLADYAAQYPFIIVVPEGKDGWYTDGTAANEKFESYFVEELIPDVDRRFRTVASREGRAVAGLSMGGYGSLKFGLKHPELFAFAASMRARSACPLGRSTRPHRTGSGPPSRASTAPPEATCAAPTTSSASRARCRPTCAPRYPIFISTAARKIFSSRTAATSRRSSSRRKFRTSSASCPARTVGPTGTGRCRRF